MNTESCIVEDHGLLVGSSAGFLEKRPQFFKGIVNGYYKNVPYILPATFKQNMIYYLTYFYSTTIEKTLWKLQHLRYFQSIPSKWQCRHLGWDVTNRLSATFQGEINISPGHSDYFVHHCDALCPSLVAFTLFILLFNIYIKPMGEVIHQFNIITALITSCASPPWALWIMLWKFCLEAVRVLHRTK